MITFVWFDLYLLLAIPTVLVHFVVGLFAIVTQTNVDREEMVKAAAMAIVRLQGPWRVLGWWMRQRRWSRRGWWRWWEAWGQLGQQRRQELLRRHWWQCMWAVEMFSLRSSASQSSWLAVFLFHSADWEEEIDREDTVSCAVSPRERVVLSGGEGLQHAHSNCPPPPLSV